MREARKKEKLYFIAISARFYELHFHAIFFVISCVPENENPPGIYFSRVFNKIVSFNRFFVRFSHAHVLSPLLFALLLWLLNFDSFFARVPRWKLLLCIIVRLRFSRRCQLPDRPSRRASQETDKSLKVVKSSRNCAALIYRSVWKRGKLNHWPWFASSTSIIFWIAFHTLRHARGI